MTINHTRRQLLRVVRDSIAKIGWDCRLVDLRGRTLGSILEEAEAEPGVMVYWGSFSRLDLLHVV